MDTRTTAPVHPVPAGPPSRHQLAGTIRPAVVPTLTALNLALGDWLATPAPVLRTLVLATTAVPIVVYGLMPPLHRPRGSVPRRLAST